MLHRPLVLLTALVSVASVRAAELPVVAVAAADAPEASAIRREVVDRLEQFVTWLHQFFPNVSDRSFHWIAFGAVLLCAILLRHVITNVVFFYLKKLTARTARVLDGKLFSTLQEPAAMLVMVGGIFAALLVLQLSPRLENVVADGATIAVLAVVLWGLLRAGGAGLDHLEGIAHQRQMTVATFMPLIKKTLYVLAILVGIIVIAESLGAKVGALLTSLGIGGLAFALAAQDTIANLFGSLVVVMDQPFRVGDTVKVGALTGTVEDIGLRSTKMRLADKTLAVIPNKSVAIEAITNLTRSTGQRVEQVLGLTYDTRPDQLEPLVEELRQLIAREPEIVPASVAVYFRDFGKSSMDIAIAYETKSPDFAVQMRLRQKLNLAFMRAIEARKLAFAFPTQTLHLPETVMKSIAAKN